MEFMPMHTFSRDPQTAMNCLRRNAELVVANNGQFSFLMIDLSNRDLISTVNLLREGNSVPVDAYVLPPVETTPQRQSNALKKMLSVFSQIENEPLDEEFDKIVCNRVNISRDLKR